MRYVLSTTPSEAVEQGQLGFGVNVRKWAVLSLGQELQVRPLRFDLEKQCVTTMTVEVEFVKKNSTSEEQYNTDEMAVELGSQFGNMAVTEGQPLLFKVAGFNTMSLTSPILFLI